MLNVIINMYAKTTSVIKWQGFLSNIFKDTMGVNQGGVISPFLFKSFLKDLASDLDPQLGIKVYNKFLAHVLWADDLFLVSDSPEKLQRQLDKLGVYCSKWHLVVNTIKTKILTFGSVAPKDKKFRFTFKNEHIEIIKDYSYLGVPVLSGSNHFKNVVNHVTQKCIRACYQVRQYCEPFGQVTPPLGMHFYETLLMPHMDYASEIWYSESACRVLDKFSLRYFKRLLHVRPNTPTLAVYGELDTYPVQVRLKTNVLKFLHRVSNMPSNCPVHWVYQDLYSLYQKNYDCWVTRAFGLFGEFSKRSGIKFDNFKTKPKLQVKKLLKRHLLDEYEEKWSGELHLCNAENNKKLRTYQSFKETLTFEPYLMIENPKYRIAISKLRMSAHNLAIETGRHKSQAPEDRLCINCKVPETEMHHVMECTKLDMMRNRLLDVCTKEIYKFANLRDERKFCKIMEVRSIELANALGRFLVEANIAMS